LEPLCTWFSKTAAGVAGKVYPEPENPNTMSCAVIIEHSLVIDVEVGQRVVNIGKVLAVKRTEKRVLLKVKSPSRLLPMWINFDKSAAIYVHRPEKSEPVLP
jgi:hypothetical protein